MCGRSRGEANATLSPRRAEVEVEVEAEAEEGAGVPLNPSAVEGVPGRRPGRPAAGAPRPPPEVVVPPLPPEVAVPPLPRPLQVAVGRWWSHPLRAGRPPASRELAGARGCP